MRLCTFGYHLAIAEGVIWSGIVIVVRGLTKVISLGLPAFLLLGSGRVGGVAAWRDGIAVTAPDGAPRLLLSVDDALCGITVFNMLMEIAGETTHALNLSWHALVHPSALSCSTRTGS